MSSVAFAAVSLKTFFYNCNNIFVIFIMISHILYMSFVAGVNGEGIGDIYPLPRNTDVVLSLALPYFLGIYTK